MRDGELPCIVGKLQKPDEPMFLRLRPLAPDTLGSILVVTDKGNFVGSLMFRPLPVIFILLAAVIGSGCASKPDSRLTGTIKYFNIRNEVMPRHLTVQVGDEVRWQNLNQHAVRLRMLEEHGDDLFVCDKGFSQLGVVQDTVTIAPQQYVSLCFSKAATLRFNVWLDADDPQGAMTPTGTIRVERRSGLKRSS